MASIKGDLSVMGLTDLLQWIDLCKKTGTIVLSNAGVEKKVYLESGSILFVSSNKPGERLGEYLHNGSMLEAGKIKSALLQSQTMKVPFTQRLIELNFFTEEQLTEIIVKHAKEILIEAVNWIEGTFEFIQGELPSHVVKGPISLNTIELIYYVIRQLEQNRMGFK